MQLKNEDNTEEKVSHKVTWVPYIGLSRKWLVAKDQEEAALFLLGGGCAQWCVNALRIVLTGLRLARKLGKKGVVTIVPFLGGKGVFFRRNDRGNSLSPGLEELTG